MFSRFVAKYAKQTFTSFQFIPQRTFTTQQFTSKFIPQYKPQTFTTIHNNFTTKLQQYKLTYQIIQKPSFGAKIIGASGTTYLAAAAALPTPVQTSQSSESTATSSTTPSDNENDQMIGKIARPPRRRGPTRNSPEPRQNDVFHPRGRPPNPVPVVAWEIRRGIENEHYGHVLKKVLSQSFPDTSVPEFDEQNPNGSIDDLAARIIFNLHRVSVAIPAIAQNLTIVNSSAQQFNRDKKRAAIPLFNLDNLASFQRRLTNRYNKMLESVITNATNGDVPIDTLRQRFQELMGALHLTTYDLSLLYSVDNAIQAYHPRHPPSFLQQAAKSQADYLVQRRNLIAKQIRAENPEITDENFQIEFANRVKIDTQLINNSLEQRRIEETRRWAQMQRSQLIRARQNREKMLNAQKKLVSGQVGDDKEVV